MRSARKHRDFTITAAAQLIGVSRRTLELYEAGDINLPILKLRMVASVYAVPLSYLFDARPPVRLDAP